MDSNQTGAVVDRSLPELEQRRARLYAELAQTGDFRRGSVTTNYRRCGKSNCACAGEGHPGHGPRHLWTRSVPGGKTKGRQLAAGAELEKVNAEIAKYKQFIAHVDEIVEVNEAICESRPVSPLAGQAPPTVGGAEKRGSTLSSNTSAVLGAMSVDVCRHTAGVPPHCR